MPAGSCRRYIDSGVLPDDPFAVLDPDGVGALIELGVRGGRATKPELKVGICGEHGGEPSSVEFCHRAGLRLRIVLAVPGADRPGRGRAGRAC